MCLHADARVLCSMATHFSTEFDAPFIAAAATASDQEKPDEGNEANSKFERLPQNRFRKVFTKFAPTVGDNLRQMTKGGKLMRRKGRSNPNTRTCVNILRLKMLKHPPRQEQQQGKCNLTPSHVHLRTHASSPPKKPNVLESNACFLYKQKRNVLTK